MSGERASIFADDDIDLSGFAPVKKPAPRTEGQKAAIREVAERKGFPSREAATPPADAEQRKPRRYSGPWARLNERSRRSPRNTSPGARYSALAGASRAWFRRAKNC
jgi:hypothetical protein